MSIKNKWDVIVVGGGASGCMAAIAAAERGKKVILLEKNEKLGKKIYITGKGRCNVTNDVDHEEIIRNISHNSKFLYGALNVFASRQLMAFFESAGCPLKVERGNRVFPKSDKSSDIIKALEQTMLKHGVRIQKHSTVSALLLEDLGWSEEKKRTDKEPVTTDATSKKSNAGAGKRVSGVRLQNGDAFFAEKVILAMGGMAYPATGSTGEGYELARTAGHSIEEIVPGLTPLETVEQDFTVLAPLLLKNVDFEVTKSGKALFSGRGEVQFTRFGLSGALVLSASSYLPKKLGTDIVACIDLKPGLSKEKLDARILREIQAQPKKPVTDALGSLLPAKFFQIILARCRIQPNKKSAELSKKERNDLVECLKKLEFQIKQVRGFKEAIITRGGIQVKEVNPKTMESKLVKGLYFTGEMLDVDALTGGYNLQIAFSTGYLAGIQE